jgi:hypothetical protein
VGRCNHRLIRPTSIQRATITAGEGAGNIAHMKKCSTRSMLHEIQRARARTQDGTEGASKNAGATSAPPQTSAAHGTATHDLRIHPKKRHHSHAGKCPLRRSSRTETCKGEAPNSTSPQWKKQRKKDRQRWPLTHETTAHFHGGVWCGAAGNGPGAVVLEDRPRAVVLGLLRLGFWACLVRSGAMLALWCCAGRGWWCRRMTWRSW